MRSEERGDVYRLVFELTARATDVPYEEFLVELVDGLASHYKASIARVHVGETNFAAASADPENKVAGLEPAERGRFDTIDSILAEEVRRDGVLRSALDMDGGEEIVNFLARSLQTPETFAFPLIARGKAFGAITLYLWDAYPFEEADVRGLQAIGNVLFAATNKSETIGGEQAPVPVTSSKLRAYQETLVQVGKILEELQFLTDAKTVLLIDHQGEFISKHGEDSLFSTTDFSSVVASGFAASRRLAGFYGAQPPFSITHEGDEESVFVVEVAKRAILAVVYTGHAAPSLITRWSAAAANRLEKHYEALTEARVV